MSDIPWDKLYEKTIKEKHFLADKAWETIKFHTILSSSLISITVGALVGLHTSATFLDLGLLERIILLAVLLFLPVTMKKVVKIGFSNFVRECDRMYEQIAIVMKLEEKLGFFQERKKSGNLKLPADKTYVSPRIFEKEWTTTKEFKKNMLDCADQKDNLYCNMKKIFELFSRASWILAFFIMGVIGLHALPWVVKQLITILF